ncbi:MAG: protein-glutamate O-methyltransferase CheR [Candidatus Eremiobacteraeota bacterium]|nr:protein-glutamate O-methyltransferase CheR [Candidatus Eremiobacteraeota bacterium]
MVEQVTSEELLVLGARAEGSMGRDNGVADLELHLLLEAVVRAGGYDYRDFATGTLKRRISERMRAEGVETISGLQERVLHDPGAMRRFVFAMSQTPTTLFRDAAFWKAIRSTVIPLLRTYSFIRLWFPACSTGEDVYSFAAVLEEAGLLDRSMIYATELSEEALAHAKSGRFDVTSGDDVAAEFIAGGAETPLSHFAKVELREIRFDERLKRNTIFAQHSLMSDGSLNEFHAILARGVLPQFNKALQYRVHNLFLQSLARLGFLALGANESLKQTPHERVFRRVGENAIYRRMR